MERKSNGLLKICGILMMVGGAFLLLLGVLAVMNPDSFLSPGDDPAAWTFTFVLFIAVGVVELGTGILGVKNAAKPAKAGVCIGVGILMTLVGIFMNFLYIAGGSINYLYLVVCLVLPILYLIGAFQNRRLA